MHLSCGRENTILEILRGAVRIRLPMSLKTDVSATIPRTANIDENRPATVETKTGTFFLFSVSFNRRNLEEPNALFSRYATLFPAHYDVTYDYVYVLLLRAFAGTKELCSALRPHAIRIIRNERLRRNPIHISHSSLR